MSETKDVSKKSQPFTQSKGDFEAGLDLDKEQLAALRRLRFLQTEYETLRLSQKEKLANGASTL